MSIRLSVIYLLCFFVFVFHRSLWIFAFPVHSFRVRFTAARSFLSFQVSFNLARQLECLLGPATWPNAVRCSIQRNSLSCPPAACLAVTKLQLYLRQHKILECKWQMGEWQMESALKPSTSTLSEANQAEKTRFSLHFTWLWKAYEMCVCVCVC